MTTKIPIARLRQCAALGMTRAETARHLGFAPYIVGRWSRTFGIEFKRDARCPWQSGKRAAR